MAGESKVSNDPRASLYFHRILYQINPFGDFLLFKTISISLESELKLSKDFQSHCLLPYNFHLISLNWYNLRGLVCSCYLLTTGDDLILSHTFANFRLQTKTNIFKLPHVGLIFTSVSILVQEKPLNKPVSYIYILIVFFFFPFVKYNQYIFSVDFVSVLFRVQFCVYPAFLHFNVYYTIFNVVYQYMQIVTPYIVHNVIICKVFFIII